MDQGMTLEQRQVLHLTPQMRQSIKILQMDVIELNHWLERESQDNPVLEVEWNQIKEKAKEFTRNDYEDKDISKEYLNSSLFSYYSDRRHLTRDNSMSVDYGKYSQSSISQNITLHEHLMLYLKLIVDNDIDYKIGEYLIGNIDENGYLGISCLEISGDLKIPEKRVKKILAMIQNCSIPGLGARNLRECLLLQLKYLKFENKNIIKKLITSYLNELARKNFNIICKKLHLSNYEIQYLLDIIVKNFDPKPGRIFYQNSELNILIPDIVIKKVDDKYEIMENKTYFPSIKINALYKNILLENNPKGDTKIGESFLTEKGSEHQKTLKYLEKKMNSARWIIRCVEQRRKTVLDITRFIIDYQKDFLGKGVAYLKPLSMQKVADAVGLHESTVSRAINDKKIQLPRGFYDMKYFFSKGLPQEKNEAISNERIKNIIKNYIETENSYSPHSDQDIADLLKKKDNIQIARRTVTKYRKLQGISSAKMRRRYRKQQII
ncbi:MAG: RNA polymerase factor sigma-54 [Atribacterota bacterium]